MGQKFIILVFCFAVSPAFADLGTGSGGGMDQSGNTFGGTGGGFTSGMGSGGGYSGGDDPNMGSGGYSGGGQTILGQLHSQGMHLYLGGAVGLGMFKGTLMATEGSVAPATAYTVTGQKKNIKNKIPTVAFTFGLQQKGTVLTDFGLMAMYGPKKLTQKTPGKNGTVTDQNLVQDKYRFVLHAAAGVPISSSLNVFGKLGLVYSSFNIGYKELGTTSYSTGSVNGLGLSPGIMLQYKMSDKWSANLDLSYTIYSAMKTSELSKDNAYSYRIKIAPKIMTILLGASMKLGD